MIYRSVLSLLFVIASPMTADASGDRGVDVARNYPDGAFVQHGGRVIDLTDAPFLSAQAIPDDGKDDTAAFIAAYDYCADALRTHGFKGEGSFIIYMPKGQYDVSDRIFHTGPLVKTRLPDVANIRFIGESRNETVVRLQDYAAGYGDENNPKPVFDTIHPDGLWTAIPGAFQFINFTIHTGKGNPGAIALNFRSANKARVQHLTIRSEDGQGHAGLAIPVQAGTMGLFQDIRVEGFDYGIYDKEDTEGYLVFEYITLMGQNKAGIRLDGYSATIRRLLSKNTVPAIQAPHSAVQLTLLKSQLLGGEEPHAAVEMAKGTAYFAREVRSEGYAATIRQGAESVMGTINEKTSHPVVTSDVGVTQDESMHLPVLESPILHWEKDLSQWASVDDFGAKGDGRTDSTAAVQAAMNSGKPVVYFPGATYKLSGVLTIPPSVKQIQFLWCDTKGGRFTIEEPSDQPLFVLEKLGRDRIHLDARRPLVMRGVAGLIAKSGLETVVFAENCANIGAHKGFCPEGITMYGRWLNNEIGADAYPAQFDIRGGTLWLIGYKTEHKDNSTFAIYPGSTVEVLGGFSNNVFRDWGLHSPVVRAEDSDISLTFHTRAGMNEPAPQGEGIMLFTNTIDETRSGSQDIVDWTTFPPRKGEALRTYTPNFADYFVVLYTSYVAGAAEREAERLRERLPRSN